MTYLGGLDAIATVVTTWKLFGQVVSALPTSTVETLEEIPSPNRVGSPVELTGKAVIGPPVAVTAADILVADAPALANIAGVVVYRRETGQTEAQAVLLAAIAASGTADGGALSVTWPSEGIIRFPQELT